MLSIAIDKNLHQQITNAMRKKIGYALDFNNGIRTTTANAQQIWSATRDVYQEFGLSQYVDILKDEFIAAGHNLDWGAPLK